jgi:hypothetical protein
MSPCKKVRKLSPLPSDDGRIISASRRGDIPAFQADWLMNHIRAGEVAVKNPFGGKVTRVSLAPEQVHSIVFWSKDYRPLLPHLDELKARGYHLFFHFTITGLPRNLEPAVPPAETAFEALSALSRRYSPRHIIWRFDPIIFGEGLEEPHYLQRFADLAKQAEGKVERCYFSFADFYAKVTKRLAGETWYDPPLERKRSLAAKLAEIAADNSLALYTCCEDALLQPGINRGHCIEAPLLAELFTDKPLISRLHPTRKECGCYLSTDIGAYSTCRHGCEYCYAG